MSLHGYPRLDINVDIHTYLDNWRLTSKNHEYPYWYPWIFWYPCMDMLWILGPGHSTVSWENLCWYSATKRADTSKRRGEFRTHSHAAVTFSRHICNSGKIVTVPGVVVMLCFVFIWTRCSTRWSLVLDFVGWNWHGLNNRKNLIIVYGCNWRVLNIGWMANLARRGRNAVACGSWFCFHWGRLRRRPLKAALNPETFNLKPKKSNR